MKKIIVILLTLITSASFAQELAPVQISKRTLTRLYTNVFISISRKVYDETNRGHLTAYKDSITTKEIKVEDFQKIGMYKNKTQVEAMRKGKMTMIDTMLPVNSTWEWVWGYRKISPQVYAVYYQKPIDTAKHAGEVMAYYKASDIQYLLGEFEWKFMGDLTFGGQTGNRQRFVEDYWRKYNKFRDELWNAVVSSRVLGYQTVEMKKTYQADELKDMFKLPYEVTVVQDSTHREYDYKKVEYNPFTPSEMQGFGVAFKQMNDPNTGTQTVTIWGISPLYDPTKMGGDYALLDAMYWMRYADFVKGIKPEDIQFINELCYLSISEKLTNDCAY